jgi:ribonuclease HI
LRRRYDVYVDAKIEGMHDATSQKKAFVGYVVERSNVQPGFLPVEEQETDEAEERAILFAITELKDRIKKFTVICDHESAVTKVNWKGDDRKKVKKDKVLPEIWRALDERHGSIRVRALKANPAHRFLNQRLKELESGAV